MAKTLLLKNLSDLLVEQGRKYGEMINLSTGQKIEDEIGSLDFTDLSNITKKISKNLKSIEASEEGFSEKLLGSNDITIPADGAHKGQSGWQSNNAWDFKSPIGGPVYAVADGTLATFNDYGPIVKKINGKKLFGQGFTVNSDNGLPNVYYAHLKDSVVGQGDKVKCGQLLGYVMDFPGSDYDHLHIGVETGNIRQFINSDGTLKCRG